MEIQFCLQVIVSSVELLYAETSVGIGIAFIKMLPGNVLLRKPDPRSFSLSAVSLDLDRDIEQHVFENAIGNDGFR